MVAVGHHNDDNVETLILNLLRGTGLTGLTGMKSRHGMIVRPLLTLLAKMCSIISPTRADLCHGLKQSAQRCEKRNRLRNVILPCRKGLISPMRRPR